MNTFGQRIRITIYGESHGASIGAVLDGLPAGEVIDWDGVQLEMARRAPGRNAMSTARAEADAFTIQSGFFNGRTTGTPLCAVIANGDHHSKDYEQLRHIMRPGHADYSGKVRYGGYNDYRGGGHFSGRLTAPLVFAGAIASQILARHGVTIGSHILQVEDVCDNRFATAGETVSCLHALKSMTLPVLDADKAVLMEQAILRAKNNGDSVGGSIECMATGLPAGLGDPFFDSVESQLSHMMFSVPAVKGIEFGDGFAFAGMRGSQANDSFYYAGNAVKTKTNHNGGINGGITNGMPILFRVAVKPTPSISQVQDTIDTDTEENCKLEIKGRHDPCIVQRAVPVIEAAAAWTLLDVWLATPQGK
ncbi:MAG: chorismate synthase [Megasphaera sp.]|jgi:chorismate synthase|nr:chorismate synthase [Megasphaera sp.]MCH4188466.1 chorismate synthase [Megasphaera sp.]MCH4218232.1 chorismate synthase [Megasphaera sp.]